MNKENTQQGKFSPDVKRHFLEIVSTYNKYQEMMDRKSDIVQVAETLGGIVEAATQLAVNEADEWFDKHTVKRNMSELTKLGTQFDKCVTEAKALDQRLGGLYEDMGHILSRYYKMGDISEDTMKNRLGIHEAYAHGVKYSKNGTISRLTNQKGKLAKNVKVDGEDYRYNSTYKTYNSIKGNKILHKSDVDKAKTLFTETIDEIFEQLLKSPITEGAMSHIDVMAQQSKDFKTFVKAVHKEFETLPKSKETVKWLQGLYDETNSRTENINEVPSQLKIGNNVVESIKEDKLDPKDVVSKDKTKDGHFFVVVNRNTDGMRGKQDKFSMYLTDKSLNVKKNVGTHPSADGAKTFGKNNYLNDNINEYSKSTASYIDKHKGEYKLANKIYKSVGKDEVKFYDELEKLHDKIGHPKYMIWLSNALRGYKVDMYKDPKIKNREEAEEALFILNK